MKTRKTSAWTGDSMRMRKAPITPLMNAPTTGMSAVNAVSAPIIMGLGSLRSTIPRAQSTPSTTASVHWPTKNRWKQSSAMPST